MNVRANVGMGLPKDFFALLKNLELGLGETYNLKNFNFAGRGYLELAFGHARDINENIRVGAKIKPLIGIADVRFRFDDVSLYSDKEIVNLSTKLSGSVLGNFVQFIADKDGAVDSIIVGMPDDAMDIIGGYGVALDLGVTWNLDDFLDQYLGALVPFSLSGFTASFGITDIGFIRYRNAERVTFDKDFVWEGALFQRDDSGFIVNIDEALDQFKDLQNDFLIDGAAKRARGLRTTTNVGLEYSFLDNKMSAGLLWSAHWGLPKVFNEWTLSYNLRPVNWFAFTLSSSVANGFFRSAGWAMNITPKYGLSFFFGMDYVPFAFAPKWDQLNDMIGFNLPFGPMIYTSNLNLNFGMSIPLGGNRYHKFPSRREVRREARNIEEADPTM
jgi:hypothetical protein